MDLKKLWWTSFVLFFQAIRLLDVRRKRRIYDIINVLEGIGLISRVSSRYIKWKYVFIPALCACIWSCMCVKNVVPNTFHNKIQMHSLNQGYDARTECFPVKPQTDPVKVGGEGPEGDRDDVGPAENVGQTEHQKHDRRLQQISFSCPFTLQCIDFQQRYFMLLIYRYLQKHLAEIGEMWVFVSVNKMLNRLVIRFNASCTFYGRKCSMLLGKSIHYYSKGVLSKYGRLSHSNLLWELSPYFHIEP